MKKHIPALKLVAIQWIFFALILAGITIWLQNQKIKDMSVSLNRCEQNWGNIEKQIGSGRIILELKRE